MKQQSFFARRYFVIILATVFLLPLIWAGKGSPETQGDPQAMDAVLRALKYLESGEAIAMGTSLSFLTPIGYQTNLMVMGPGGYQPRDYLRAGWPLALLMAVIVVMLTPVVWPFELKPPV